MDPDAVDLIQKLLQKDITRRYGNLREGAKDIKNHAFYAAKKFDWANFAQRGEVFRPDAFDASKYEWLAAESVVTESKRCKPEDQQHFAQF